MSRGDAGSIVLYGGGLVLTYYVLKSWGIISTPCDPSICTPQCPRGPKYSRGYFGDCDPNYLMCDFGTNCCCINSSSDSGETNINNWKPLTEKELDSMKVY